MFEKSAYIQQRILPGIKNEKAFPKVRGADLVEAAFVMLFCFVIGRAVIFKEIAPFGVALFAVLVHKKKYTSLSFISIAVGLLSCQMGGAALKYIGSMGLLFVYSQAYRGRSAERSSFSTALGAFLSLGLCNLIYCYGRGFLTYDFILAVLESIVGFMMVYVFKHVVGVLFEQKKRRILSSEEIICMSISFALLIVGFWDITILGFSAKNILSVAFTLTFAYIGGAGVGASIGLTLGFILSLSSGPDPILIGSLGICGLISGTFKELGRLGSGVAFVLANALIVFYINRSTYVVLPFHDIVASVFLLLLMPQKLIDFFRQFIDYTFMRGIEQNYYAKRMKELTRGRLNEFARVFRSLSRSFERISEQKNITGQEELSRIFDLIADQVCTGCALYRTCWNRDFYNTYSCMFEMLTTVESQGKIERDSVPQEWSKRCIRLNEVIDVMNHIYSIYRSNMIWQKKINECRQLVAQQLDGVSQVVTQLAAELDIDMRFKRDLETAIQVELDKMGIRIGEVLVIEKANGKFEVNVKKKSCCGKRECTRVIEKVVSQIMGRPMTNKVKECAGGKGECTLQLEEAMAFQVVTGIARKPKLYKEVSGDSYSFTPLQDGKYMLAISDGMGSGKRAAEESGVVISLLENFLEAGFDLSLTMNTINSILMLRSSEEIYATVDLCVMDLISAGADFIKIGSVSSFIKHPDNTVEIIKASTLPIGILDNLQIETLHASLEEEDMIVMVTDGILDYVKGEEAPETALQSIIADIDTKNPQEMAERILEKILEQNDHEAKDDMTVMVSRIWKTH